MERTARLLDGLGWSSGLRGTSLPSLETTGRPPTKSWSGLSSSSAGLGPTSSSSSTGRPRTSWTGTTRPESFRPGRHGGLPGRWRGTLQIPTAGTTWPPSVWTRLLASPIFGKRWSARPNTSAGFCRAFGGTCEWNDVARSGRPRRYFVAWPGTRGWRSMLCATCWPKPGPPVEKGDARVGRAHPPVPCEAISSGVSSWIFCGRASRGSARLPTGDRPTGGRGRSITRPRSDSSLPTRLCLAPTPV